ncbi:hypothetical protein AEA09_16760 [Lysinibacillus contaminans]|uniref:DUF3885 domain-containing protein n=1 Tax=Lysinibacillus contaminans TaxID=1293441 RepID=A0ABR5JX59_9BACI|nr:DUF3885 domain-containing protein [Lysinibacillus contaminans]KOS66751.1 hypothetical protein AEA09_16760 [Lysinibacillus contaminans]
MDLGQYLNNAFPGLTLVPSLYHQWDIGIHFELGGEMYQFRDDGSLNLEKFDCVYSQALSIFNELFSDLDEIFLVTNVYRHKSDEIKQKRIKVYDRNIKNKDLKLHLKQETLPYVFDHEGADDFYTSRFSLKCCKQDFNYPLLIKAACNEDFPLKPKFSTASDYPDVFFINITKNVIFFIYDDRGCEIIATNKETIYPLYEKYGDWFDEYSREEIVKRFK